MGDPGTTPSLIAFTSAKTCGKPPTICFLVLTGAVVTANACNSQLVVHPGSMMENGKPLAQRANPAHCQPPQMASPTLLEPLANFFPAPIGSAYDQSAVMRWVVSKSDTPRLRDGFQTF